MKPVNNLAWILVAPAAALMLLALVAPLAGLLNFSLQDAQGASIGVDAYRAVLTSQQFWLSAARSLGLAALALAVELPLGVFVARYIPRKGWGAGVCLSLIALPLLIPGPVSGLAWRALFLEAGAGSLDNPVDAWLQLAVMDVWRWTSLVALLAYAGITAIPEAWEKAARVDGARGWTVFLRVQLPQLWQVLSIAAVLRFVDAFMAYAEPMALTNGGAREATTLMSMEVMRRARDGWFGEADAMGVVFFVVMLMMARGVNAVLMRPWGKAEEGTQ
jgi:glycerol transport system permease protein